VTIKLWAVTQEDGSSVPGMVAAFRAVFPRFEHVATRRPPVVTSIRICALPWHAAVLRSHDDLLPEHHDRAWSPNLTLDVASKFFRRCKIESKISPEAQYLPNDVVETVLLANVKDDLPLHMNILNIPGGRR
jgi:hypothetical protein